MKNIFHGYLTDMAVEITKLDIKEKQVDFERENAIFSSSFSF